MMRRYHRWLSVLFGILVIWIAVTGLMSHGAALVRDAQGPAAVGPIAAAQTAQIKAAGFVCPENMTCRVKPDPNSASAWTSYMHHLHAGEEFGAIGTTLSILSGVALLFFALSGLWMYYELYRGRLTRKPRAGDDKSRFFWK